MARFRFSRSAAAPGRIWVGIALLSLLAGCTGVDSNGGLATSAAETTSSSICSPANSRLEARFGWDGVKNYSEQDITLRSVTLDEQSRDIEIVRSGFIAPSTGGTTGGVGPYDGTFAGAGSLVLTPGRTAVVDVVLRSLDPHVITVAYGLVVEGIRADGRLVRAHTCWALAVAPSPMSCSDRNGDETYDPRQSYMQQVCTVPDS